MPKLVWDELVSRYYDTGLDRGVFYPDSGPGEAWNGLVSVDENPTDSDESVSYFDGKKYRRNRRVEQFGGTISAYLYPPSFPEYDGVYSGYISSQRRRPFGFSYRAGQKIHLVYNVFVLPSQRTFEQKDISPFSWDFVTVPIEYATKLASAHFVIDRTKAYPQALSDFESILYGSDTDNARLPLPDELYTIFERNAALQVVDNGDGTFTVTGPDDAIQMLDPTTFQITWPSATYLDAVSYEISTF